MIRCIEWDPASLLVSNGTFHSLTFAVASQSGSIERHGGCLIQFYMQSITADVNADRGRIIGVISSFLVTLIKRESTSMRSVHRFTNRVVHFTSLSVGNHELLKLLSDWSREGISGTFFYATRCD